MHKNENISNAFGVTVIIFLSHWVVPRNEKSVIQHLINFSEIDDSKYQYKAIQKEMVHTCSSYTVTRSFTINHDLYPVIEFFIISTSRLSTNNNISFR